MFSDRKFNLIARRIALVTGVLSFGLILAGCAGLASSSTKAVTQAGIAVTPGSFDFKTVAVGQTLTQTMQIANTGSAPVQISALSLSSNQFAISGPSVPRSILPGMNLQYTVAFTPGASGNVSASLNVTDDASKTPISISLKGAGEKNVAALQLTPTSINFGNLALQTMSTQNVTLQNTGDVNLAINGVTVVGAGFGYSDLSPGYSLSPNQKVTFQVWFKPQVKGAASGQLSILAANLASPAVATLSGDGVSTTGPTPPTPTPTAHSVHLSWGASTSSVVGYRVYRGEVSGGPYSAVTGSSVDVLSYDDATVSSGSTYYYVVTALDSTGDESSYSNQASAIVPTP